MALDQASTRRGLGKDLSFDKIGCDGFGDWIGSSQASIDLIHRLDLHFGDTLDLRTIPASTQPQPSTRSLVQCFAHWRLLSLFASSTSRQRRRLLPDAPRRKARSRIEIARWLRCGVARHDYGPLLQVSCTALGDRQGNDRKRDHAARQGGRRPACSTTSQRFRRSP